MKGVFKVHTFNVSVSIIGCALFAAALYLVQFKPHTFERMALAFATTQVQERVSQSDSATQIRALANRAAILLSEEQRQVAQRLTANIPEFVASVVAAKCSCETRSDFAAELRQHLMSRHERLGIALDRLEASATAQYQRVKAELRSDVRVFLATNLFVFVLALSACLFRGEAKYHLAPICSILITSVVLGSSWYVFGQDWLTTIAFSDYLGYGYSTGLGLLTIFLIDILFFHATLTSAIFSAITDALGVAFDFTPC